MELKPFDLIYYKGRNPISCLIQGVTKSPYSHVAIYLGNWMIADTNWGRPVSVRPLNYPGQDYDVYRCKEELTSRQIIAMETFIRQQLGTRYALMQSLMIGANRLHILKRVKDTLGMNCTEFAERTWCVGNMVLTPSRKPWDIDPGEQPQSQKLEYMGSGAA